MSNNNNSIALNNTVAIEKAFHRALSSLNLNGYKVRLGKNDYPIMAASHPGVLLPRLAMRAEELSIMVFGARLFKDMVYIVHKGAPTGYTLIGIDDLTDDQREDDNFIRTAALPVVDETSITHGLYSMLLELSIAETFDIDKNHQLLIKKAQNLPIHKMFKTTNEYEEGQCFPLLSGDYLAISELNSMMGQEMPLKALNKAREKVAEILRDRDHKLKAEELDGPSGDNR